MDKNEGGKRKGLKEAASRKKAFFQFYIRLIYCLLNSKLLYNEIKFAKKNFWHDAAGFLKITLIRPSPFKKGVLPGRVKCGGTEGEIVVAHGHLPSPARYI